MCLFSPKVRPVVFTLGLHGRSRKQMRRCLSVRIRVPPQQGRRVICLEFKPRACHSAAFDEADKSPSKVLLLVRHGESLHNISEVSSHGDGGQHAGLYDAPLSPLGELQVAALADNSELRTAELVLVSPLTRCLQTLHGAFPHACAGGGATGPPVQVWAGLAEHLTDSCDIGSGAAALAECWPRLDFTSLPEVWWYTDEDASRSDADASRAHYRENGFYEPESAVLARVHQFVANVHARPERVVAVFGHSDYFNHLLEEHGGISDYWLANAEVKRVEIAANRRASHGLGD